MTAAEFSAAFFPEGRMVFGVPLLPLCVGHALLLQRLRSPFAEAASQTVPGLGDLLLAVEICRRPPPQLPSAARMRWLGLRQLRLTPLGRARLEARHLDGVAEFRAYWAEAHSQFPEHWPNPDARDSGVPMTAALLDGLLGLGYAPAETLAVPVSRAIYLLATHSAREGNLKLMTAAEAALIAASRAAGPSRMVVEAAESSASPAELLKAALRPAQHG